ncbi:MAG: 30S ribosomal protein S2, partial [Patescibacteria group bacterium]|nr:30S ribosomal protein S2 [Patescibacteria group bacterium]
MEISVKDMLEAGVYFGHQTSRWNPKMKPYLFGERDGIHIFDLDKTAELLADALSFLQSIRQSGRDVLLIGTKGQARHYITEA